ncbi:MAG: DUF4164 domain-containing protein [Hyphomicrobiaceae bacterium]|nr:DUF4164 domain-containing protein [Hyphomicrobiaceae bacterium]
MGKKNELTAATERLDSALKVMEEKVASRRQEDLQRESLEEQVQTLEARLDEERARNQKLVAANEDATQRIDKVMSSIEGMLQSE